MIWLAVVIGAVAVTGIAFVAVGIAVGRMEAETAPAVFHLPTAVEYVAANLPEEVASAVSYEEVRLVLSWHLDWFATVGLATGHGAELGDPAVAVGDLAVADTDAAQDAIVARTMAEGGPEPVHVLCILDAQLGYLAQIGALSVSGSSA